MLTAAALVLVLASGCARDGQTYYPEWEKSRWQRLDLFRNVEGLAIAPLETGERVTRERLHYVDFTARAIYDQIMRRQRFRLVEPERYKRALEDVKAGAGGGASPDAEKDAIAAAARAGADAVLVVRVEDVDPYFPPKIVMRARMYVCRQVSLSEKTIINMTGAGVPLEVPRSLRERFIWQRDIVLDAREENTMAMVKAFAGRHEVRYSGLGPEVFVRSMERYSDFAAAVLAGQLFNDAEFYKTIDKYNLGARARGLPPKNGTQ